MNDIFQFQNTINFGGIFWDASPKFAFKKYNQYPMELKRKYPVNKQTLFGQVKTKNDFNYSWILD